MPHAFVRIPLILVLLSAVYGCSKPAANRIATFPVTGSVLVDGEPVEGLAVFCTNVAGLDKQHPTQSSCFTKKDGSFEIGTYESKDGVPEGEYALTFRWGAWNLLSHSYEGDKLDGRYSDPKAPFTSFTVKQGQPTKLGEIKLSTK
jgi:hypothetical protein